MLKSLLPLFCAVNAAAAPLELAEAEKELLLSNPQVQAAARDLDQARAAESAARAGYFPSFRADASYSRSGSQRSDTGYSYAYGFSGTQPLFAPALPAAVRSAAASRASAEAAYDSAASRLRQELRAAFAEALDAAGQLALSEETLKRRAENLELIKLKYEAGRENKAALMETEAALARARWQHVRYRNALSSRGRRLNRLLGRPLRAPAPEPALPAIPSPESDFSAYAARLGRHYALRSARASLEAARASLDTAAGARLPEASANGAYRWSGTDLLERYSSWSLGASVSVPLFAGGRLAANADGARARVRSSEASLRSASDELWLAAEDAWQAWGEADGYLQVAKTSLDAAQARAWLVRKQYLAGQASYFEWRAVEEQLIEAQTQSLSAARALHSAHAAFQKALGE